MADSFDRLVGRASVNPSTLYMDGTSPVTVYVRATDSMLDAIQRREVAIVPVDAVVLRAEDVNVLAQAIRHVDGNHSLGAGALAEALLEELRP